MDKMSTNIDLFTPLELGTVKLENRIVMAPMTRSRASGGDKKIPSKLNGIYYAQRASAGLIITEATQISTNSTAYPNTPGIFTPEQTEGWKLITDAVHQQGGESFLTTMARRSSFSSPITSRRRNSCRS